MGEALPLEIRTKYLPELHRISNIVIFDEDKYLILKMKIPLIHKENYQVYHPIPLPIPINHNSLVLIAPEVDYLALSSDSEKFLILTQSQWEACLDLRTFKMCKGSQSIYRRDESDLYEAMLFDNMQSLSNSCNIKYFSLEQDTPNKFMVVLYSI